MSINQFYLFIKSQKQFFGFREIRILHFIANEAVDSKFIFLVQILITS